MVGNSLREERVLTEHGFSRLLEWLDDGGADSKGEAYLEMRRRLVSYFDRRNRPSPDELADETLNRIARTLEEDGAIAVRPPARYCYVIARFVMLEDVRKREHATVPLESRRGTVLAIVAPGLTGSPGVQDDDEAAAKEQRLGCLERCLDTLKPEQRALIVDYHRDARREKIDRRRDLAKQFGISMNALAIRACRIRDALETCVEVCCTRQ
jgi:DNA-directed RNA polymerase specialized sigma24 family protein